MKPLNDNVVVERLTDPEKSPGGIYVPDAAKEKPVKGKVVAVGPGKLLDTGKRSPLDVKVGDTVVFGKYGGLEVDVEGKKYLVMKETDLLVKL